MIDQITSRRLTEIEDVARGMRNASRRHATPVMPGDIEKLFDLIAQLAQAVREGLQ